jgi:histidinol dehydrogenase
MEMKVYKYPEKKEWKQLLRRPAHDTSHLITKVEKILKRVKSKGDKEVIKYTKRFDGVSLDQLAVSEKEMNEAAALVSDDLKQAIYQAKKNIELFHAAQIDAPRIIETMPGVECWRKMVAIEKVGLYIPGGTAPLFSTVLMLGVPAKLAGCKEIILCTPPQKNKKVNPAILFAAQLSGITKIFKAGGVQAIAAMAVGTETIPAVYKIFGPGNQYVTQAKLQVQQMGIAIDMPAGPSEVAVYADETANAAFVAADLLSQAEHGPDSQVLLVGCSRLLVDVIQKEIEKQLAQLPRKQIAAKALQNSKIILVETEDEAMELLNAYAPEHLILNCANAAVMAEKVMNAGSVFIGPYSCESAGDYASGTNHTLPTNGFAKVYSGVSIDSFVKQITFQKLSEEGLNNIGKHVEIMAEAEGLKAHAEAVRKRMKE